MRRTPVALLLAFCALVRSHAEQVVFTEVMYNPPPGKPEFVEILNLTSNRLDLAKWRLRDGVEYTFPAYAPGGSAHFLLEYERILVSAADPATTRAAYPDIPPSVRVFGPWSGTTALDDAGERIFLEDAAGARLCELNYRAGGKWPVAANGTGHSIIVANANRKIDDWRNWQLSPRNGGSPGSSDTPPSNIGVRLSEAHFRSSGVDWVELGNLGTSSFNGDGYFVASLKDFSDKVPLPASIPVDGQASVAVNFPTDGGGDLVLYLIDAQNNVVDSVALSRRGALTSVQRFPLSSSEWYYSDIATRDAANNPARHDEIVINEIMFATPSRHDQGQFIELINKSGTAVNLSGWRLADGLRYEFPAGTTLAAGAYLVVAKDPAFLAANYGGVSNVFGPADGSLRRSGELVRLEDDRRNLADSVDFRVGGEWPVDSGGAGSSLELLNPEMDNSRPSSWRASDESAKSTFQSFSHTGLYRELRGTPSGLTSESRELLLNLVSDGHIVMRNISLANATSPGTNLLTNGDRTSHSGNGSNGFLCTGTHCMSDTLAGLSDTLANGFHLISTGSGDTKANKAEVDVTSLAANNNYILSFEARWVSGVPLLVAQTWDRSFGKVFRLPLPNNLGTPGAENSRFNAAPPPTVDTLSHSPKVPTSTQPVVVTARVSSVAPLSEVTLFHATDAGSATPSYTPIAMNDSGTGGDALAGDGIWSGTIGAKNDGAITQFYVLATSSNGQTQDLPRNATGVAAANGSVLRVPARPAMYIVDNSPPPAAAGILTERYILSLFDRASLNTATGFSSTRDWDYPRMSNFGHNATMIYNESDVVYNCEMRKGGSPWTRDGSNTMARIRYRPPGDNQWRNRSKSGIDNDAGGSNRFHNRTVRYMLYMLGYPIPDSEFCQRIVNADPPGLGDDQEQTDDDFFDRAYADLPGGELFEIDDAWYVYDRNNMDDRLSADSVTGRWALGDWTNPSITLPSEESPIYFHGNWPLRFPEERYDYASLAAFIKTAYNGNTNINTQPQATQDAWREQMERMIDVERAAAYAAARGYIGDWDNFTMNRGKNGYFYRRPTDGKFEFHHWDSDLGFDASQPVIGTIGGTGWTNLSRAPYFRRHFHFYLSDLQSKINGANSRMAAFLAAMNYQSANPNALAPFKTNVFSYTNFFSSRNARITSEINSFGGTNTTRVPSVSTPSNQTVDTPLFTLNGEAPAGVYSVDVLNHPEGLFKWVATSANAGLWTITDLALANDANALTVRFLAQDGTVLSTVPFTVTFTGNGFPLPRLTMNPASGNLAANEVVTFDGSASTDPENGALTFVWSVVPATGAVLTPSGTSATARFTVPGTYTVTMTAIDPATNMASTSRAITVSNADDFVPFSSKRLPAGYTVQNAEYRDNYSPSTWLSLEDNTGRMLIQITDDAARPLAAPAFTFPLITRDLPDSADFILQTKLEPMTRKVGNWQAGLWLEMVESGVLVRYALDLDGGLNLRVRSAADPANFSQLAFTPHTGSGVTMRVRRTGDSLFFERQVSAGVWTIVHTQAIAPGSRANTGGIFSATSAATSALIAFDYILVADSTVTNNILSSLRITEVMYHPASPDTVEFIELKNIGAAAINLAGCRFAEGEPFAEFVFPNIALNPGGYVVLTNNINAFTARYGASAAIVGQWDAGNGLSNSGENIRLLDPHSNEVHNFSYATIAPWPTTPDGQGPSLEVIDVNGNYALGTNWRASFEPGGSPGYAGAGPDSDGDGAPDSWEVLFGSDPNNALSLSTPTGSMNANGQAELTFPTALGKEYRIDYTDSLSPLNWQPLTTVPGTGAPVTITDTTDPKPAQRFYHIVVLP
jgi:hypothetical protein